VMEEATRDRLLDAAERLFAEHGYQATTMRGLTAEAEANIAAVNYHFGCKQSLLEAVVHRALAPVVAERRRRLEALGEGPPVEAVGGGSGAPPVGGRAPGAARGAGGGPAGRGGGRGDRRPAVRLRGGGAAARPAVRRP